MRARPLRGQQLIDTLVGARRLKPLDKRPNVIHAEATITVNQSENSSTSSSVKSRH